MIRGTILNNLIAMKINIRIPDIAENVKSGIIASVLVAKGDQVEKEQPVVEVETDKATTDIPTEHAGKVIEIKVNEGDEVEVGQVIMVLESEDDEQKTDRDNQGHEKEKAKSHDKDSNEEQEDRDPQEMTKKQQGIAASPLARKVAREHEVDIGKVEGTGPGGRITKEDIISFSEKAENEEASAGRQTDTELPDFSKWGNIFREPMDKIRKLTADRMSDSWQSIPLVTQFDEADITEIETYRNRNKEKYDEGGGKLTITSILLKLSAFALQRFPRFNASIDTASEEIIYKQYYNIGVAVDTKQGLIVPVVKDVDKKSLAQLTVELTELAEKARNKKISTEELQGGNFTISNLGGIGGTNFTPIVYSPQVAILGVARSRYRQVHRNEEFEKRLILPFSLSYDHRVVDGAEAARFLRWICEVLEDPFSIFQ